MKKKKSLPKKLVPAVKTAAFAAPVLADFLSKKKKSGKKDETLYFNSKFGKIHYTVCGSGKPVLLLHSQYLNLNEWQKNAEYLSKKFTVYAIDLLGFGLSDKPKTNYNSYLYALIINSFVENVIKESVFAVSSSKSASFLITAYNLKRENFAKMILISPEITEFSELDEEELKNKNLLYLPVVGNILYKFEKASLIKFFENFGYFAKELVSKQEINKIKKGEKGNLRYAYACDKANLTEIDFMKFAEKIDIPLMIVWGEENEINPIKNMDYLEKNLKQASFLIFEKTKLFPHMENFEEFNKEAENFFE